MDKGHQYQFGTLYFCICQMDISWSDLPPKVSKQPKMSIFGLFFLRAYFETQVFSIITASLLILVFLFVMYIGVGYL